MFDLDQIQIHPTQAVGAKTLISETVRGAGAILVNREGKRFVNEVTTRDHASAAVLKQTGKTAFVVFDEGIKKSMKLMEGYFHLDLVKERHNAPRRWRRRIGVDGANLAQDRSRPTTGYQAAKHDAEFERDDMARSTGQAAVLCDRGQARHPFHHGRHPHQRRTQVMSQTSSRSPACSPLAR